VGTVLEGRLEVLLFYIGKSRKASLVRWVLIEI
jgi:hypothetical protein